MTINLLKRKTYIILFSIVLLGLVLRADNLTKYPRLGATFDEYAWTWLGMSLIKDHVPSSWSNYEVHKNHREYKEYQNVKFWIITPYLEHPPFFGLIAGSFAYLNGANNMYDINLEKIRPLAIALGLLSIIILFYLVRLIYDDKLALLASLIYATTPTIVIGSRLVQNENFFIPMYLLSLFLIFKFIKSKSKSNKLLFLSAVICGLLALAKVPWLAAGLSIGLILIYNRKYKQALLFAGIVSLIFSSFFVYGAYYNFDLFINLWRFQVERYEMAFTSIYALFTQPYLADRFLIDGWIYFGWFAFILLLIKDIKKNYIIIFGLLAYFAVFIFAIPDTPGHGWYRYPFYPFLAISISIFLRDYFNKNLLLTFFFIVLLGTSLLEASFRAQFGFSFMVFRIFLISTSITLLPLFSKNKQIKKYSSVYNSLMLIMLFSLNVWAIMEYTDN